jgi:hypothetical protein
MKNRFHLEQLDRRLLSPKIRTISQEMQKRSKKQRGVIALEVARSGNSAGYATRLFEFEEQLIEEWVPRVYAAYRKAWRQQNGVISPDFIRALSEGPVAMLIGARASAVREEVVRRAAQISEEVPTVALSTWERIVARLASRWKENLECDAAVLEYREAARQESSGVASACIRSQKRRRNNSGRPRVRTEEFTTFAGQLWIAARNKCGARISNEDLARIACGLDDKGYVPPSDYLEPMHARELKAFNSKHSNSREGPILRWQQLVRIGDKDHLRGMRRLLSRCGACISVR